MAGGMRNGRVGIPLSERVSRAQAETGCPARHCWVAGSVDGLGVKRPGLLVEWRHTDGDEWEGRVIYAAALRDGQWTVVEEWLPAAWLAPA